MGMGCGSRAGVVVDLAPLAVQADQDCVTKNFQRGHCKNTFFKIDGEAIGGQGVEKSFQMVEVCLPVRRTHTGVVHVCKHTF